MALQAIVENLARRDMNPMEEAAAFRDLLKRGYTPDRIANELGLKSTANVTARMRLFELTDEIQHMVATGSLPVAMAQAVAMIPQRNQPTMVRDISVGRFKTVEQVRHAAIAIKEASAQVDAFATAPKASQKDVAALRGLERQVEAVKTLVAGGFKNGECVAAKRVDPSRVAKIVEELTLCRKHILQMEHDLRCAAAQATILFEGV